MEDEGYMPTLYVKKEPIDRYRDLLGVIFDWTE